LLSLQKLDAKNDITLLSLFSEYKAKDSRCLDEKTLFRLCLTVVSLLMFNAEDLQRHLSLINATTLCNDLLRF